MTSDLIECDEYKMTNPYCASRLTREYNKMNDAKNGSCIVTNFATDKYIFSDGKFIQNINNNIVLWQIKYFFNPFPQFVLIRISPQLLILPSLLFNPSPILPWPSMTIFFRKNNCVKLDGKQPAGTKMPKMNATVNKIYLVLIIKFLFDKNL